MSVKAAFYYFWWSSEGEFNNKIFWVKLFSGCLGMPRATTSRGQIYYCSFRRYLLFTCTHLTWPAWAPPQPRWICNAGSWTSKKVIMTPLSTKSDIRVQIKYENWQISSMLFENWTFLQRFYGMSRHWVPCNVREPPGPGCIPLHCRRIMQTAAQTLASLLGCCWCQELK